MNETFCIVDQKPIPPKRAVKRSVTCSDGCAKQLAKIRRAISSQRQCHQCHAPSTPEERRQFAQWRRDTGQLAAQGRPKTKVDMENTEQEGMDAI